MNIHKLLLVLISLSLFQSCTDSRWKADTSKVEYNGEILRLDKAVFSLNNNFSQNELVALKPKYGNFLDIYLTQIMQVGSPDNPMTASLFARFLNDPDWRELQSIIEKKHPNLDKESAELENALKRYAVLFQETELPEIVAYNSGFNVGIYPEKKYLGIGLEWYAGSDLEIFKRLPPDLFPQYKRDKMLPEFMTINALKGWLLVKYQDKLHGETLLNRMAFAGKIHYVASVLMEEVSDRQLLNYSQQQIEWSEMQEYDVWKHMLENDLIFSEDAKEVSTLMNDGPFTPGMPPESPGGVGNYIGYKMVEVYMERNENVTLVDLLNMENDREFLNNYKPGR
ncbi:hypothetical protein G3O08_05560 [Cryomorpha ignava]|uniref:Gliding motility lipoprotein GldB n=1 Tax=Cryomorpha ignava TaxID=101383 RepID=A0A7K3WQC7_9FLAO|nr:hypothetical protein [Cryomorpha ignava]